MECFACIIHKHYSFVKDIILQYLELIKIHFILHKNAICHILKRKYFCQFFSLLAFDVIESKYFWKWRSTFLSRYLICLLSQRFRFLLANSWHQFFLLFYIWFYVPDFTNVFHLINSISVVKQIILISVQMTKILWWVILFFFLYMTRDNDCANSVVEASAHVPD